MMATAGRNDVNDITKRTMGKKKKIPIVYIVVVPPFFLSNA